MHTYSFLDHCIANYIVFIIRPEPSFLAVYVTCIFRAKKKSTACLPWGGSKAVSHVADLRGMSKNPGFTWKSKAQAKLTGHFSPVIPSFADRGLSCHMWRHLEAKVGTSKGGGKQWQPTPKKPPRMQCARAIPVA